MRRANTLLIFFATLALFTLRDAHALILPESSIDQPVTASDAQPQFWPAVAFNGSVYVVVWQDEQSGTDLITRFARFDKTGQPIGAMQTLPVTGAHNAEIASNGKDFLLIWRHEATPVETFGVRLDGDGNFVANSIIGPVALGEFPKVASNGADYVVFAASPRSAATRVTAEGFGPVNYSVSSDLGVNANIASDGDGYLAVWVRARDGVLYGARITADGFWAEPAPFPLAPTGAQNPTVAFSNGMYLAVWQAPAGQSYDLFARRIPLTGPPLDATAFPITRTGAAAASAVGPYSDGFRAISYHFDYATSQLDVRTFTVSTNAVIGANSVLQNLDSTGIEQLAITARGTNAMVTWTTFSSETHFDVLARFIPADGAPGETQILEPGPNIETAPAIATGANGCLVVWQDNRNSLTNRDDIFGRFVDAYGRPKGDGAFAIGRSAADQSSPAVAAAGDHYLVAWREVDPSFQTGADIKAALLVNDSIVKEFTISATTNDQRAVSVASDGRDFLVVWRDSRSIGYNNDGTRYGDDDIYALHVTRDGELSGPENGFPICQVAGNQMAPAVASNGTNYLVVWRDNRALVGPDHTFGAIVNPGETNKPSEFQISFGDAPQRAPDVASNGRDYFVVWRDSRNRSTTPSIDIYGTPVSAAGKVADTNGIPLLPPTNGQREPSIASIGEDYVLVWLDVVGPIPTIEIPIYTASGRTIHADGSVSAGPLPLNATPYDQDTLAFAANRESGIGLMTSQTAANAPRVRIQSVCLSNCPVVLSVASVIDGRTLIWNAEPNKTYRIEFKRDLIEPTWNLLTQAVATTDGFLSTTDDSADTTRFYRIVLAQ